MRTPALMTALPGLLVLALSCSVAEAQLLESLLPTYFSRRPKLCTGPSDCSNDEKMELTKHVEVNGFYWGGFLGHNDAEDEYYSCLDANENMCLVWEVNEYQRDSTRGNREYEHGTCQCIMTGTKCTLHTDSNKNPAPGNLTRYMDGACDPANYNGDCGWDGGDCEGVSMFNGTVTGAAAGVLDYTLPSFGSDKFCSVWTCEQTEQGASTYCSSYYYYYWRDRRGRRLESESSEAERRNLRCRTAFSSQGEYTECACTEAAANGNYCAKWYCEEDSGAGLEAEATGNYAWYFYGYYYTSGFSAPEFEWYECVQESNSGVYCASWKGVVQSDPSYNVGELEVSSCRCTSTTVGSSTASSSSSDLLVPDAYADYEVAEAFEGHCTRWECEEDGWAYWNPSWTTFGVILFFILVSGVFACMWSKDIRSDGCPKKGKGLCVFVTCCLVVLVFDFLGWWSAGYVGGIVYTVVLLFIILIGCGVFKKGGRRCRCPERHSRQEEPPRAELYEMSGLDRGHTAQPVQAEATLYPVAQVASPTSTSDEDNVEPAKVVEEEPPSAAVPATE